MHEAARCAGVLEALGHRGGGEHGAVELQAIMHMAKLTAKFKTKFMAKFVEKFMGKFMAKFVAKFMAKTKANTMADAVAARVCLLVPRSKPIP
jgi:uncharacterized membrane protein YjjP (DUF1212 family)